MEAVSEDIVQFLGQLRHFSYGDTGYTIFDGESRLPRHRLSPEISDIFTKAELYTSDDNKTADKWKPWRKISLNFWDSYDTFRTATRDIPYLMIKAVFHGIVFLPKIGIFSPGRNYI